jgi:hypothetical protein
MVRTPRFSAGKRPAATQLRIVWLDTYPQRSARLAGGQEHTCFRAWGLVERPHCQVARQAHCRGIIERPRILQLANEQL